MLTSLCTSGDTKKTVGNAKTKANIQALNQMLIILLTRPTLKTLITSDIIQDISKDIKNENISLWCLRSIIDVP